MFHIGSLVRVVVPDAGCYGRVGTVRCVRRPDMLEVEFGGSTELIPIPLPRLSWWKRLLVAVRLAKKPVQQYNTVTHLGKVMLYRPSEVVLVDREV